MKKKESLEKIQELFEKKGRIENQISQEGIIFVKELKEKLIQENIDAYIPPKKKEFIVINEELLVEYTGDKLILIKELQSLVRLESILITKYASTMKLADDIISLYRNVTKGPKDRY